MTSPENDTLRQFQWQPQPAAAALIGGQIEAFVSRNAFARRLAARLLDEAGVRLADLVDHLVLPPDEKWFAELSAAGFVAGPVQGFSACFGHEGGIFPRVIRGTGDMARLCFKVESVADFAAAWEVPSAAAIEGSPLAPLRKLRVNTEGNTELWAIERHGFTGLAAQSISPALAQQLMHHGEALRRRPRRFDSPREGFAQATRLAKASIDALGVARTCDLFFASEREYWQRRNTAGQAQRARQDRLGIGWANHDHHTYRSSRTHFADLIALMELLGLQCRERFYTGAQAGWGAQILEQPQAGIVVFADVDLSPEELRIDFAHDGLPKRKELGTVGLWCGLHGEAILEAGMHHLECQFDFAAFKRLAERDGKVMPPFTDFPYLRQAFTEGETWPVGPDRIEHLLQAGQITADQARQFAQRGAIGSHLEDLERNDGFKGFNQSGVSQIIAKTDPRKN